MSDEPALLAAIRAHPDEDTPRLIYADWLDENGQPERAEFIRLQCAPEPTEQQSDRLYDLCERGLGRWLTGLPQFTGAHWEFRRGFPEHLEVHIGPLLDRFEAFARVPWLRFVSVFEVWNDGVRDLCNRDWPPQWVELDLVEALDTADEMGYDASPSVAALAGCPAVWRLRRLRLAAFTLTGRSQQPLRSLRERLGTRLVIE